MGKNHRGGRGGGRGPRAAPFDNRKSNRDANGAEGDAAGAGYTSFQAIDMQNEAFEEYYKGQDIVPESEWSDFIGSLRKELPLTFRVTGSREHAETINELIKSTYVPTLLDVELDGIKYDPPSKLTWYPGGLGWQVAAPKRVIRKSPEFKVFQRFLVGETEVGNLSRQEAVSMIPPLLLDVESHHKCLDMCAAPGSKTAQIIEALNPHHTPSTGLCIANDSDYKRTHMLVHQTGRMPSKGLIVTNLDASMFPNIKLGNGKTMLFDRILADVPCSGDGTLRKNSEIWNKWGPTDGNSLHTLQMRILDRAMHLLKPGGRLVYSTCSFNPSENEAVIAASLNSHPGQFTLVDVASRLPELKRRPGLTRWRMATQPEGRGGTREMKWHDTYEEYRKAVDAGEEREKDKTKGLAQTCWPPANAAELNLERCLRLLPHDQDTGGFFVCVLEKAGPSVPTVEEAETTVPVAPETPQVVEDVIIADEAGSSLKRAASPVDVESKRARQVSPVKVVAENDQSESIDEQAEPQQVKLLQAKPSKREPPTPASQKAEAKKIKKERRDLGFKEDPYSFVDEKNEEVGKIVKWFQLDESFPKSNLLVRNEYGEPLRTVYLANDIVKTIIQNNDYTRLRIISAGVKAFVRQDSQNRNEVDCKWRIPSEGIAEVLPHVGDGIVVDAGLGELRVLLEEQYPVVEKFEEPFQSVLKAANFGNMIVKFRVGESHGGHLALPLFLPLWKAKTSMSLLIDKREKSMLSLRTYGEDICRITVFKRDAEAAGDGQAVSEEVQAVETESAEPTEEFSLNAS